MSKDPHSPTQPLGQGHGDERRATQPSDRSPLSASRRWTAGAICAAILCGACLSLQTYLNGRVAAAVGSVPVALAVNCVVGTALLLVASALRGTLGMGVARLRRANGLRVWHLLASACGATMLITVTYAAPRLGIAALTVALVSGQILAGMVIDGVGLSPAQRRRPTLLSVLGGLVAIAAVSLGLSGESSDTPILLLVALVLAGGGFSLQQAGMGHVRLIAGDPFVPGLLVIGISGIAAATMIAITWPFPLAGGPESLLGSVIGGLLSLVIAFIIATSVGVIGALRLALTMVMGQLIGGLLIDLTIGHQPELVTASTILAVIMTAVAVAMTSFGAGKSTAAEVNKTL